MFRTVIISLLILFSISEASAHEPFRGKKESIVEVYVVDQSGRIILNKKGYVIDKDGLIATGCNMILKWYKDIKNDLIVKTWKDKSFSLYRLIAYNPKIDLAIFKIKTEFPAVAVSTDERVTAYIRKTVKVYKEMVKDSAKIPAKEDAINKGHDLPSNKDNSPLSVSPYLKGLKYFSLKRYKEAIEEFNKALKTDSSNPEIYANLGLAYYKIDRYRESIESYKKALLLNPDSRYIYKRLGALNLIIGEYDSAIEAFQKALQLNNEDPKAHFDLAITLFMKGDRDLAWQEYIVLKSLDEELSKRLWDILN